MSETRVVFRGAAEEEVVEVKVELSVRLGTLVVLLADVVVNDDDDVVEVSLVMSVGEDTGVVVGVVVTGGVVTGEVVHEEPNRVTRPVIGTSIGTVTGTVIVAVASVQATLITNR